MSDISTDKRPLTKSSPRCSFNLTRRQRRDAVQCEVSRCLHNLVSFAASKIVSFLKNENEVVLLYCRLRYATWLVFGQS